MRHPAEFLHLGTRMVYVPTRLHWHCAGKSGVADHRAIAMIDDKTGKFCLSEYQWFEGNDSCDCNRLNYCGLNAEEFPDLFHLAGSMYSDGSGPVDVTHERCGNEITITKIESLDPLIPSLDGEVLEDA